MPPRFLLVVARAELPGVDDRDSGLVLIVLGLLAVAMAALVLCVAYFWVTGRTARHRFAQESTLPPAPTGFYGNASTQTALLDAAPRPVVTNAPPPPVSVVEPDVFPGFEEAPIVARPSDSFEPSIAVTADIDKLIEPQLDVPFAGRPRAMGELIEVGEAGAKPAPAPLIQALDGVPLPNELAEADQIIQPGEADSGGEIPNW